MKAFLPLLTRITLAGCGAKASAYSGVYEALDETGVLPHVDHIAGSSSGSFSAAMIASNVGPKPIKQIMQQTNLAELMGPRTGTLFGKNPGSFILSKSGDPLETFIRHHIAGSIKHFLNDRDLSQYPELHALYVRIKNTHNARITFQDLEHLHQRFPQQFKQLTVHAVTHPDGKLKVFNSKLTPQVDIAEACRASSSIPIILQPKHIDNVGYMDGSIYENLPTEFFDMTTPDAPEGNKKPHETLVFGFGSSSTKTSHSNTIFQSLFKHNIQTEISAVDKFQGNILPGWLVGLEPSYLYTDRELAGYQRIQERYALRTVQLHAGGMQSFDFDNAKLYSRILDAYGYLDTIAFIINHEAYDPKRFDPGVFYEQLLIHFFRIYQALLIGSGQDIHHDPLWMNVQTLKHQLETIPQIQAKPEQERLLIINREIFQYIKEQITQRIDTEAAFALSRATETKNNHLSTEQLTNETRQEAMKHHFKQLLFQFVYMMIYHDPAPTFDWNHSQLCLFNELVKDSVETDLQHMEKMLHQTNDEISLSPRMS